MDRGMAGAGTGIAWREVTLVWAAIAAALLVGSWSSLDDTLRSPDNVMRLVEVRALWNGAPWFDPFEPRLAPPDGYLPHWSRLVDAGLVGLLALLRLVAAPDLAERLMRALWPLLLLLPAMLACVAVAQRIAGAGRAAMVFAIAAAAMMPTFRPGEIDHHNIQVMLVLVALAGAAWAERSRAAACTAGIAAAALLGIGFEAIYLFAILMAAIALAGVFAPDRWSRPAALALGAAALAILPMWLGLTPSALRWQALCDALSVNVALPVVIGAGGAAFVMHLAPRLALPWRLAGLALVGAAAFAVFAGFDPRCLQGPYGTLDPAVFPLWLNRVQEVQGIAAIAREDALEAVTQVTFPLIALAAAVLLLVTGRNAPHALVAIGLFGAAFVVMLLQVRGGVFAIWLGVPIAAAGVQLLAERLPAGRVEAGRLAGIAFANPMVSTLAVSAAAGLWLAPVPSGEAGATPRSENEGLVACARPAAFAALAALPRGVVMGHLDLGASVLAHTPHSVLAAPYHRIDRSIVFNQSLLEGPLGEARAKLRERGVNYVIECTAYRTREAEGMIALGRDMFRLALLSGRAPDWLEPVPNVPGSAILIWRVKN